MIHWRWRAPEVAPVAHLFQRPDFIATIGPTICLGRLRRHDQFDHLVIKLIFLPLGAPSR